MEFGDTVRQGLDLAGEQLQTFELLHLKDAIGKFTQVELREA